MKPVTLGRERIAREPKTERINVRVSAEIKAALERIAADDRRSVSAVVAFAVEQLVDADDIARKVLR